MTSPRAKSTVRVPALDPDNPAFETVKCDPCHGTGRRDYEQRLGHRRQTVVRSCRDCSGTGKRLAGDPATSRYSLTLDYRVLA